MSLESLGDLVPDSPPNIALVRLRPVAETRRPWPNCASTGLLPPVVPDALYDVERVPDPAGDPGGVLAFLGLATLVHSLVSLVRSHRRDLALLKTLGFTRPQVAATTAWQGTAFVAAALVCGLPLGVAAGRWAWRLVADQLVESAPRVPVLAILLIVPAALLVANLAAAVPNWLAARTRAAEALRASSHRAQVGLRSLAVCWPGSGA